MSERITEDELADLHENPPLGGTTVRVLVSEVMRLRGLIVRGIEPQLYSEMQNPGALEAREALEAEARAISDEGTCTCATVYPGPTVCCRCHATMRAAEPGHEGGAVSHGICAECVPAYRAEMGLPPQRG